MHFLQVATELGMKNILQDSLFAKYLLLSSGSTPACQVPDDSRHMGKRDQADAV
jgi:hypothetical protein